MKSIPSWSYLARKYDKKVYILFTYFFFTHFAMEYVTLDAKAHFVV